MKANIFHNPWSKFILFLLMVLLLKQFFSVRKYETEIPVPYDMGAYYAYLPLTFIHHDIANQRKTIGDDRTFGSIPVKNGNILKMTMGVSIMQSPFFLAAHSLSLIRGKETTGYTRTYMFFIYFSGMFYAFLGLIFTRKILLKYFPDLVTAITLLVLMMATNLWYYSIDEAPMSHAYNFFLFSLFIFLTLRWHQKPKLFLNIFIGIIAGLIVLIRPTNLVLLLIFPLWNIYNADSFKQKITFYRQHILSLISIAVFALLAISPQLFYWKFTTGSWLFYSYGEEKLWLTNSHLIDGLFSFRKGWLIYTPVMAFSIIGMFFMRKINDWKWIIPIVFFIYIYVVFSWWCWWYGGSFSSRPMIDMYPLLAISLAAFLQYIFKQNIGFKIPFIALLGFCIYLNFFQINQYRIALLHWDSMNKNLYKEIFLKDHYPPNYDELKTAPDYGKALKGEDE